MSEAKKGDTVKVHYTGKLEDDTVFDSSEGRDPLEFKLGTGMVIPGFENAITGMKIGDTKTVNIPVCDAYGERYDEMVGEIPRDKFPSEHTPEIGAKLQMQNENGDVLNMTIVGISDECITIDGNHPLAGKDLTFEIELVEIS